MRKAAYYIGLAVSRANMSIRESCVLITHLGRRHSFSKPLAEHQTLTRWVQFPYEQIEAHE